MRRTRGGNLETLVSDESEVRTLMARAIWTGSISFGLLNVPVKLYSADSKKNVTFR